MNESIKLIECPRDAWQGLPQQIPTERKVEYLRALIAAGFRHLDAVSFVSPKAIPQLADSEAVLAALQPPNDVEIIGIVVNEKGAERAQASGAVTTLGYPFSISETFLRRNQNQSPNDNRAVLEAIAQSRTRPRGLYFDGVRKSLWRSVEQRTPDRSGGGFGLVRRARTLACRYDRLRDAGR